MSIPSINFKARPAHRHHEKPAASRPRTSTTSGTRTHRPVAPVVDFSSDSDLDELPSIKTSAKHASEMIALPNSDSDPPAPPEEEAEAKEVKEVNWSSKAAKPANYQPRQAQHRHRRRKNQNQNQGQTRHEEEDEEEQEQEKEQHVRTKRSNSARPSRQRQSRNMETFNFTLIKEAKKMIKKHGAEYRLMDNDSAVMFANSMKDEEKAIAILDKVLEEAEPIAIVRKQHRGKRTTIADPKLEKPNDDRPAELFGMCYVHLPECKTKMKTFRVAFPKAAANYPVTEERELARIAEVGEPNPRVLQYATAVPSIGPDGQPVNIFGGVYKLESVKNYVINDDKNNVIFMLYKTAEGSFNIKGRYPFTPLTAFGLSVSIIAD